MRRAKTESLTNYSGISIHAPAKGATYLTNFDYDLFNISIHAPAKGATFNFSRIRRPDNFNPRTREGCDDPSRISRVYRYDFNPRTREGCDFDFLANDHNYKFQSTHPRRVRPAGGCSQLTFIIFQSTHPRRVRPSGRRGPGRKPGFQSTHPRRVRQCTPEIENRDKNFNPRTREGCDSAAYDPIFVQVYFNPRTREGCDAD